MALDKNIKTVLLLGSGPIVIGQACEFDYSGTQACKALQEEGCRVVLVNSNPATIMTDPDIADVVYIEPLEWETLSKIIEKERPDVVLPTMGGQTALNCVLDLEKYGVLEKYNVKTIGANTDSINKAEDRELFEEIMQDLNLNTPKTSIATNKEEARKCLEEIGCPCVIRPSYTLGGGGGGIAYNEEEFFEICESGFKSSPNQKLLIDESLVGWKEYEMEVVRDKNDNCIIVCSIENINPMGVHTGDSITVAPAQTLTDKEYQLMRDASFKVLRAIGVETGGSNVQFAINPENGYMVVIEMNPRVSRSSALASKATGFPIAKVATKLALGYTLDELTNDITDGKIPCSFEPTIDYVVTKIPKFSFDKFPEDSGNLTTRMKSVGEVMAIGGNFSSSLQKALCSLEMKNCDGLISLNDTKSENAEKKITKLLTLNHYEQIFHVADAFRIGLSIEKVYAITKIDTWFLHYIHKIIATEKLLLTKNLKSINKEFLLSLKNDGFSDSRIAFLIKDSEENIRNYRQKLGVEAVFKRIDSCAGEFSTSTAYMYSTYDKKCEAKPTNNKKIIVVGSGPNRIGQGVEFDYCCVHAADAIREMKIETIMLNCNPETVSTDFDISDRLYFEPITIESILNIIRIENPMGVVLQFGGQTPLKLATQLQELNIPIVGTQPQAIDNAENREKFSKIIDSLSIKQPENFTSKSMEEIKEAVLKIGYPVMIRPSYVLGGSSMRIVYDDADLNNYLSKISEVSEANPILVDKFLHGAIEVDVDAISDGEDVVIGGIMEHIEQAGIHSGDSACSLPTYSLSEDIIANIKSQVCNLTKELKVIGLLNAQFAIQGNDIYIIEANPRASRTIPFISKCINKPMAKIAMKCALGVSLKKQGWLNQIHPKFFAVKETVFPFIKFSNSNPELGPEMKSTGEVMGVGKTFGQAFNKATVSSGYKIPQPNEQTKTILISVKDSDKKYIPKIAKSFISAGFEIMSTAGTANFLKDKGIQVKTISKVGEGRPNMIDSVKNKTIGFIINTVDNKTSTEDSSLIRMHAIQLNVFYVTTIAAAQAVCEAIKHNSMEVNSINKLHKLLT